MRSFALLALVLLMGAGCARVYRPITVVPPAPRTAPGAVAAAAAVQPWGDNSGCEAKARDGKLHLVVLAVENRGAAEVRVALDPASTRGARADPAQAYLKVRQSLGIHALYPLAAVAVFPTHNTGMFANMANTVSWAAIGACGALAVVNLSVAMTSNGRLEAFLAARAWQDGPVPAGGSRDGLLYLVAPPPGLALRLKVTGDPESLDLEVPLDLGTDLAAAE